MLVTPKDSYIGHYFGFLGGPETFYSLFQVSLFFPGVGFRTQGSGLHVFSVWRVDIAAGINMHLGYCSQGGQ